MTPRFLSMRLPSASYLPCSLAARVLVLLLLVWGGLAAPAGAQAFEAAEPMYYVIDQAAMLYHKADSTEPYVELGFHEPVYVLGTSDHWFEVRTADGARGYVHGSAVSNLWIRVSKAERTVYLYRGTHEVYAFPADLGHNAFADKVRQGNRRNQDHWRTPEGHFYVVRKNPRSKFYKALVINYPNAEDAARGLQQGLISQAEYDAIVQADRDHTMPPMGTALGGMIEVHGRGTGARSNWTQGCVAVHDDHIDALWRWVKVGTPVVIEP